jgi:hypothetical protein
MKRALPVLLTCATALQAHAATYYVVVAGLGGEPDYEQRFTAAAKDLHRIFTAAGPPAHVYMLTGGQATLAHLVETIGEVARSAKADDDFALILIGHGSFDGVEYKFNLVGPDVTAAEIATMCDQVASRRQLIVDATSASGGAALLKPSATPRRRPLLFTIHRSDSQRNMPSLTIPDEEKRFAKRETDKVC